MTLARSASCESRRDVQLLLPSSFTRGVSPQAANGRYVLGAAQAAGKKTIQINVTRPADLTEFGGEWVKMYEKVARWHYLSGIFTCTYRFHLFACATLALICDCL